MRALAMKQRKKKMRTFNFIINCIIFNTTTTQLRTKQRNTSFSANDRFSITHSSAHAFICVFVCDEVLWRFYVDFQLFYKEIKVDEPNLFLWRLRQTECVQLWSMFAMFGWAFFFSIWKYFLRRVSRLFSFLAKVRFD